MFNTSNLLSLSMKFNFKIVTCLLFLLLFAKCSKDDNNDDKWKYCTSCTLDSWIGEFTGTGNYNNLNNNNSASNVPVTITIEETAPDYLTVNFQSPDYMSLNVSGDPESAYIISFAGSNTSVTSTLYTKDGVLRMNGNAKKFHIKTDTLVTDEIINFEAFKIQK